MVSSIQVPQRSRYKNTPVYRSLFEKTGKVTFFGTWDPIELRERRLPSYYTVASDEVHPARPDLIAWRNYGDPALFWPIALRNGIFFPLRDLSVGMILVVPHKADIVSALNRSKAAGTTGL